MTQMKNRVSKTVVDRPSLTASSATSVDFLPLCWPRESGAAGPNRRQTDHAAQEQVWAALPQWNHNPDTIRSHVRNAMAKTGAHTRAQLVALLLADGLLEA